MNRINQMIGRYATDSTVALIRANECGRDGFFEEGAQYTADMLEARHELKMWIMISKAVRGWQL